MPGGLVSPQRIFENHGMKIFVTGGAGFVGANLVRYLLAHTDAQVTVFDALTYAGSQTNLEELESNSKFSFVLGDVCHRDQVTTAMRGHEIVVHLAAESHVDRSIESPDVFAMTNCVGTNIICDVARQLDVQRVIHVGTDEVYGSVESGSSGEDDLLQPSSPYSATKASSDLIALSYFHTFQLPVIVTRSANQFGPFQFPEKIIPLFIQNLLDDKRVPLYGDGMNVRTWMYVEDNCAGLETVLRSGTPGEIYHLGSDTEMTNIELTQKLLKLCGKDESLIQFVPDRLGHDARYAIDSTKAMELGWRPCWNFDDALAATVDWYRKRLKK